MRKRIILLFLSIFYISTLTYGVDAWIRINQLGYLPNAQKKAVLISESPQQIEQFSIHDALTNEELGTFSTLTNKGEFQSYKSTCILDFSTFKTQGAFYIKAGLIYSPTIFINKNTYLGTADLLLNFIRNQRSKTDTTNDNTVQNYELIGDETKPATKNDKNQSNTISETKQIAKPFKPLKKTVEIEETIDPKPLQIDVQGGWYNASNKLQDGATTATIIYHLLFAYQMNPTAFADKYDSEGKPNPNSIPDILDEARWGLDWLLKMYPSNDILYHQISNNKKAENTLSVYLATRKPQGELAHKNKSTGLASIAGKYSSAFGMGSEILSAYDPKYSDLLKEKALTLYQLGKKFPGVCQSVTTELAFSHEEDNWTDDMELAATQLYRLTYEGTYIKEAARFGRMEPVTPWMCSDTAQHYQWYPFINIGHYMLANVENPRYQKEFTQNLLNGIQRMSVYAKNNPFNIGIPLIQNSNNLIGALATQCRLYRSLSNDSTYLDMETALVDWLFGRNPWGTSMIAGMHKIGNSPKQPFSSLQNNNSIVAGSLVSGPVTKEVYKSIIKTSTPKTDLYERFQSNWAIYQDNKADYLTNKTTLDGTASLAFLLSEKQKESTPTKVADNNTYTFGGITRTDSKKKQISLIFSGDEYADGYKTIRKTLRKFNIKASFFFTGNFYRKSRFRSVIKGLQADNHYLGGHSDRNLLYCSMQNKDSLLISKVQFLKDISENYVAMNKFKINKNETAFFLPPYECYNDSISLWCKEIGIQLISSTPGTLSNTDNSTPEMRSSYFSSNEIYSKIIQLESNQGLNGNILLFHIGSDKQRKDKFYPRFVTLLAELLKSGYEFVDLYQSTDVVDRNSILKDRKNKRKN